VRILLASDYYPPFIGGAHRQTRLLARMLQRRGHDVSVATGWSPGLPRVEDDGLAVHRVRQLRTVVPWILREGDQHHQPPFPDPVTVVELRRVLHRVRPEIVHAYGWITYSMAAAMWRTDIPLLLSLRDYAPACPKRTLLHEGRPCSGPRLAKCLPCATEHFGLAKGTVAAVSTRAGAPLVRRRLAGAHSVSSYVQRVFQRDFLRGRDSIELEVIPSFLEIDLDEPPVADAELDQWLAPVAGRPFMLFVGALRREKGVQQLFDAYAALERAPALVLMGTREVDTPASLPPGAVVIEKVPHRIVMAAWDRCLFGVLPSLLPEPLGSVVYEGMSRGRAVIGTYPGGHTDMITDGVDGLLVPSGDVGALRAAMQRLVDDPALCRRLGDAAGRRAQAFTGSVAVPRYEELYERVLRRHAAARAAR
jgi:glycosyltransferase involved in cell wall biosynthesis